MNKVINLDDYRDLEEIIKQRLGAKSIVIGAVLPDEHTLTFIENEMSDMELVYIIQTLQDRRLSRALD